jgi:hypothetical protein
MCGSIKVTLILDRYELKLNLPNNNSWSTPRYQIVFEFFDYTYGPADWHEFCITHSFYVVSTKNKI